MKKLGKIKTLAIASLSALAIATPIALAQTGGTGQDNKQVQGANIRAVTSAVVIAVIAADGATARVAAAA